MFSIYENIWKSLLKLYLLYARHNGSFLSWPLATQSYPQMSITPVLLVITRGLHSDITRNSLNFYVYVSYTSTLNSTSACNTVPEIKKP